MKNLHSKLIVKVKNQRRMKIKLEGRKVMDNRRNKKNMKAILN